jgi:hypothetical protein
MFFSRFHVKQLIALSRLLFADATIRAFQAVADCLMAVKDQRLRKQNCPAAQRLPESGF